MGDLAGANSLPIVLWIRGRSLITGKAYSTKYSLSYSVHVNAFFSLPPPPPHGQRSPPLRRATSDGIRPPLHFPDPSFSGREVLISYSLPPSNGARVVSSHFHVHICSRTLDPCPACHLVLAIIVVVVVYSNKPVESLPRGPSDSAILVPASTFQFSARTAVALLESYLAAAPGLLVVTATHWHIATDDVK